MPVTNTRWKKAVGKAGQQTVSDKTAIRTFNVNFHENE